MANKIQIRRGAKANLPLLSAGEPALVTNTGAEEVWVGTGSKNIQLARQDALGKLDAVHGENLLDNGDFSINQDTGGSGYWYAPGYTVDRWKITSVYDNGEVDVETLPSGKTVTLYGDVMLCQYVDRPERLLGKYVTFTAEVLSGSGNSMFAIGIRSGDGGGSIISWSNYDPVPGIYKTTAYFPISDARNLYVVINVPSGVTLTLKGAFLEEGTISTYRSPVAANPALELLKCQRHRLVYHNDLRIPFVIINNNSISALIQTPIGMRASPEIKGNVAVCNASGTQQNGFSVSLYNEISGIIINGYKTNHGMTIGSYLYVPYGTMFDANL